VVSNGVAAFFEEMEKAKEAELIEMVIQTDLS